MDLVIEEIAKRHNDMIRESLGREKRLLDVPLGTKEKLIVEAQVF